MDTLVSIGVTAAYAFSVVQLCLNPMMTAQPGHTGMNGGGLYFEVAAVVTTFLLLGRYLEANAKRKAGNALKSLLNLGATKANIMVGGEERTAPASSLVIGDIMVIRPGEKIPTDGSSYKDNQLLIGLLSPVSRSP